MKSYAAAVAAIAPSSSPPQPSGSSSTSGSSPPTSRRNRRVACSGTSPNRSVDSKHGSFLSGYLSPDRNSEHTHAAGLAASKAHHDRVRAAAIHALHIYEMRVQYDLIRGEQRKEEERIRTETHIAEEELRLRALREKKIPKPPPPLESPKAAPPAPPARLPNGVALDPKPAQQPQAAAAPAPAQQLPAAAPTPALDQQPPAAPSPRALPPRQPPQPVREEIRAQTSRPAQQATAHSASRPSLPDRYLEIHQQLKKLRKHMQEEAGAPGSPLKVKLGEMRRVIRRSIGQLTIGKGANTQPTNNILRTLRESLDGSAPSSLVDVTLFLTESREPVQGCALNDTDLPSLFLYLINIFAKCVVNQFTNECGANHLAADPIGIVAASIFSQLDFQWRGKSLIDILMAKFRVACPVLFGVRADESTDKGRAAVGWRKESGVWVAEPQHVDRMVGLGAGFAAISLRNFGRASRTNPYPPSNYWRAMAFIVNSPPDLISDTQCVVLGAMIRGFEHRLMEYWGNAALEAMRFAIVQFPQRARQRTPQVQTLEVLANVYNDDLGVKLK